jgi:hypothetical protein
MLSENASLREASATCYLSYVESRGKKEIVMKAKKGLLGKKKGDTKR